MPAVGQIALRPATDADAPAVAVIWHRGWRDGHEGHVPNELVSARTEASFHVRAFQWVGDTTVATVGGDVAGNARARRFYERNGWIDRGLIDYPAATDGAPLMIPAQRYEKRVVR